MIDIRTRLYLLKRLKEGGYNGSYVEAISNAKEWVQRMQSGGEVGGDKPPADDFEKWRQTLPMNLQDTTHYNLREAYSVGMVPGDAKSDDYDQWSPVNKKPSMLNINSEWHMDSVNHETEEWLKSKNHPSAWMELQAYSLNPELYNSRSLIQNEKGRLQYIKNKPYKMKNK